MTKLEENKAIVRRFLAAVDGDDLAEVMKILHPEHELEYPGNDAPMDREGHWRLIQNYHIAFNDMAHTPIVQLAEGESVVTRGIITGTHTGPLAGLAATGRKARVPFVNIALIREGRICGMFSLFDSLSLQNQLSADQIH